MIDIEQALIFKCDGRFYAIDSNEVIQILRVPKITKVPFLDSAIRGICPIEGSIVAVFDCRYLLERAAFIDTQSESARLITFKIGSILYALMVEEVQSSINIDTTLLEESNEEKNAIEAIYKNGENLIQILSLHNLLSSIHHVSLEREDVGDKSATAAKEPRNVDKHKKYLFFKINKEQFALEADSVREIIFNTEKITEVADSKEYILGMITIRGEVIVTINLSKIFEMQSSVSSSSRIIIVERNGKTVGLLIDAILDIRDVKESEIDTLPERFHKEKFCGVVKHQKRLTTVIEERLINMLLEEASSFSSAKSDKKETKREMEENILEMVTFRIGKEEYCFDINMVDEIIRHETITTIPYAPKLFRGAINLRGRIIPIISLHERFGVDEEIDEETKILVCKYDNFNIGFLVDSVDEVAHIDRSAFKNAENRDHIIDKIVLHGEQENVTLNLNLETIITLEDVRTFRDFYKG